MAIVAPIPGLANSEWGFRLQALPTMSLIPGLSHSEWLLVCVHFRRGCDGLKIVCVLVIYTSFCGYLYGVVGKVWFPAAPVDAKTRFSPYGMGFSYTPTSARPPRYPAEPILNGLF